MKEKKELDLMGQVIMKHHKKAQIMKKKARDDRETAEFMKAKKYEEEMKFKNKLR